MNKKLITLLLVAFSFQLVSAEKDKDAFTFDKKSNTYSDETGVVFTLEKTNSTSFPGLHNFYFNNKDGKHLIFVIYKSTSRARYRNQNNPTGKIPYYEVNFVGLDDKKCEIRYYESLKNMGKLFYDKKLISNGELNADGVKSFIMESGTSFTDF